MSGAPSAVKVIRSARYELLDPLRGIAILAVMFLHFSERGTESGDNLIHDHVWPVLQHGYLGVQLFFVISGYCITAALYNAAKKTKAFSYFVRRRLSRIFPPYWASILLVVALGIATIMILGTAKETVFPLTTFDWACNVFLVQGPLDATDANLVYWSLSIELQFYFVMAVALLRSDWTEHWLIAISVVFLGIQQFTTWPLYGTVLAYWSEFVCGIAAYYWITGQMRWRWTPAVLTGLVLLDIGLHMPQYDAFIQQNGRFIKPIKLLFCLSCLIAMLSFYRHDATISASKPARLLAWFGLISYSLYLTHVPLGTRVFNLAERVVGLSGMRWLGVAVAAMCVAVLGAWIFFRLFEKPWLNPASKPFISNEPIPKHVPVLTYKPKHEP